MNQTQAAPPRWAILDRETGRLLRWVWAHTRRAAKHEAGRIYTKPFNIRTAAEIGAQSLAESANAHKS